MDEVARILAALEHRDPQATAQLFPLVYAELRALAAQNPAAYRPDLAQTLNNLVIVYRQTHRFAEAEAAYKEAVGIRRVLAAQNPDGGYPQQRGSSSNAQSTSWAIQGLIAAGYHPSTVRRRGSRSPLGYLESLLAPGGSIRYSRTGTQTPVWVTAQALIALAGRTFPVA